MTQRKAESEVGSRAAAHTILAGAVLACVAVAFIARPIPQPAAYHAFADGRRILGIPNGLGVLSNLPFALVGALGLWTTRSAARTGGSFRHRWERWPYLVLFGGVMLTTVGSMYYHLEPDNARLVWDRLPMTVGFMGLLTALVAERVGVPLAKGLFGPLLVLGATSVAYWYWTELQGSGDLRAYLLVQFWIAPPGAPAARALSLAVSGLWLSRDWPGRVRRRHTLRTRRSRDLRFEWRGERSYTETPRRGGGRRLSGTHAQRTTTATVKEDAWHDNHSMRRCGRRSETPTHGSKSWWRRPEKERPNGGKASRGSGRKSSGSGLRGGAAPDQTTRLCYS